MKVWKVILAALVIYCAGVVTGGLTLRLDFFNSSSPEKTSRGSSRSRQRPDFIDRMQKELGLSPEQRQRISQILQESRDRMRTLWDSVSPKADEEFRNVRTLILAELTAEQAKIYEEQFKSFGSKRRHNEGERRSPKPSSPENNSSSPPVPEAPLKQP